MARKPAKASKTMSKQKTTGAARPKAVKRPAAKPAAKAKARPKASAKQAAKPKAKPKAKPRVAAKPSTPKRAAPKRPAAKKAVPAKAVRAKAVAAKPAAKASLAKSVPAKPVAAPTAPAKAQVTKTPVAPARAVMKPVEVAPPAKGKPQVGAKVPGPRGGGREVVRVGDAPPPASRPAFARDFLEVQRKKLMAKKEEILKMYRKDLQNGQESNDSPTEDLVDRANNAYNRELAFSISDNERELLLQIDQAIERLNGGSYGYCLHTGHPIGLARLDAIPWAKYSVEAQEMLEKGLLSEA